jgi:hypothetical protein
LLDASLAAWLSARRLIAVGIVFVEVGAVAEQITSAVSE